MSLALYIAALVMLLAQTVVALAITIAVLSFAAALLDRFREAPKTSATDREDSRQ